MHNLTNQKIYLSYVSFYELQYKVSYWYDVMFEEDWHLIFICFIEYADFNSLTCYKYY